MLLMFMRAWWWCIIYASKNNMEDIIYASFERRMIKEYFRPRWSWCGDLEMGEESPSFLIAHQSMSAGQPEENLKR